jgi:hypothetical protein
MHDARTKGRVVLPTDGFNYSTSRLINKYLEGKTQLLYGEGFDSFPPELITKMQEVMTGTSMDESSMDEVSGRCCLGTPLGCCGAAGGRPGARARTRRLLVHCLSSPCQHPPAHAHTHTHNNRTTGMSRA